MALKLITTFLKGQKLWNLNFELIYLFLYCFFHFLLLFFFIFFFFYVLWAILPLISELYRTLILIYFCSLRSAASGKKIFSNLRFFFIFVHVLMKHNEEVFAISTFRFLKFKSFSKHFIVHSNLCNTIIRFTISVYVDSVICF